MHQIEELADTAAVCIRNLAKNISHYLLLTAVWRKVFSHWKKLGEARRNGAAQHVAYLTGRDSYVSKT